MLATTTGFSTNMTGFLNVGGHRLALGQLGSAHCIVREAPSIGPSKAEIVMITDGRESRLSVFLPDGISPNQPRVAYQSRNAQNGNGQD